MHSLHLHDPHTSHPLFVMRANLSGNLLGRVRGESKVRVDSVDIVTEKLLDLFALDRGVDNDLYHQSLHVMMYC